ncbi:suppressor of fused domain protein [Melittangium boletus]|uniref:Uncharacterized protein n=1 Tax=Melittangium boletus DSM 14713 TaxID=1294270 RepID=A0A250IE21_9BACT|nr:suppressor of fused domain protein [Melittangium boletus]ATB30104.1 hypothetical protein MEBOL_003559 [Melittangium boletus DSM 14713]
MTPSPRFFYLSDDVYVPDRWDLGTPTDDQGRELDDYLFKKGEPVSVEGRLRVPIRAYDGKVLDFTEAGISVPVVSAKTASVFSELAPHDIQLIPVDVEAHPEPFFILVCTRVVKCIDDARCASVQYWKPEDERPELTGTYRAVYGMRIDPSKVGDAQVFRPWGWVGLMVSENIKQALERVGATGLHFEHVTGPSELTPEQKERQLKSRARRERIDSARDAFWRTLGTLDSSIIPIAAYGSWPAHRQVWRIIGRPHGHTLLVTDGLSDYFVDQQEDSVGFGLELALETDARFKHLYKSWPTQLLQRVSTEVSEHAHVRQGVLAGLFSMEVSGEGMPKALLSPEGRVAVLLGVPTPSLPSHFAMPDGQVKLITVKALLPSELAYLLEHGADGLAELSRRFQPSTEPHLSRSRRAPVVGSR